MPTSTDAAVLLRTTTATGATTTTKSTQSISTTLSLSTASADTSSTTRYSSGIRCKRIYPNVPLLICTTAASRKKNMNTLQIEHIIKNVQHFNGVYSADKLFDLVGIINRNYNKQPTCFISNTQPSTHPGEHWVLFYVPCDRHRPIEFFDSFGYQNNASFLHSNFFRRFIVKLKRQTKKDDNNAVLKLKTNISRIQDVTSDLCGHYCIVYTLLRLQPSTCRTMAQILTRLLISHHDHEKNDLHILRRFKARLLFPLETKEKCKKQQCCKPMRKCKKYKI